MTTTQVAVSDFPAIEEPIRAELFSVERLEQHAESLAAAQTVTDQAAGRPLIPRVADNGRSLLESYRAVARAIKSEHAITPAAEWLVDNFYIVEEQLREIRDDLPPGYYRKLPKLAEGPLEGYPRVYGLAWAYVAHTDSRFDPDVLRRFVAAYQRVQPLTIGELWAVAITLRVVLVENLRRIAERIVNGRKARADADVLADSLLGAGGQSPVAPAEVLRRFENKPLERAFAVQLVQRLRDLDPKVGPILLWLDERLAAQGTTADEIVREEHQQQAAMSVTVRNIITSMRLTSAYDWHSFFEGVSMVDAVLRQGSNFGEMDFATRDQYRRAVEDLSRGSDHTEIEVAERAVHRAKRSRVDTQSNGHPHEDRQSDPGYYLIATGRRPFERELGFRLPWRRKLLRMYVAAAVPGYLGTIAVLTAIVLALPLARSQALGVSTPLLFLLGLVALVPASDLAITLINRAVTDLFGPRTLPRLELKDGVPEELRTMIVVPTLLTSPETISEQVERLEVHYLANSDGDLRFALLSDWMDADNETMAGDDELLAAAVAGIEHLNQQYVAAPGGGSRFFLFHRKRVWNECQQKWMGWERKRGKLHELNQFLRGATDTTFLPLAGAPPEPVMGVRYVITLDADTHLPRGAAARLVGTMAHALNRPKYDASEGRVVDGYGLVQPRITPSLPTDREASRFQKIFSGPSGIDPYASAVSDVYQDLFREGSYTGKGIYDIDAFEEALQGKVVENALLSHDLFEGIFARAALATDIELFDEFPSHYETAAARQHRWARGDWQLLPWVLGFGRGFGGNFGRGSGGTSGGGGADKQRKVHIPAISRWKMIDNLRRTLSAPCMFLTLLAGWLTPGVSPWLWTRFILTVIAIPSLIPFLAGLNPRMGGISKRSHFRAVLSDLSLGGLQITFSITFLAYQAWLMTDAIVRTLSRLCVTHKNLLEWMTAAQAKYAVDLKVRSMFKRMLASPLLALGSFAIVYHVRPAALHATLLFVILWIAAPEAARWISQIPPPTDRKPVVDSDVRVLRMISRRTWRFFENFVTADDHWLPPDNFQETPKPILAHRTSPTNIGLYLLSTVASRDLGWLGTLEATERLEATIDTIGQLEQFQGHFYNWYDTSNLQPLRPTYVSSVDSGNMAGHFLALENSCREMIKKSSIDRRVIEGARDAIELLREALVTVGDTKRTHTVTRKQLGNAVDALAVSLDTLPTDAVDWAMRFVELRERSQTVADIAQTLTQELGGGADAELRFWGDAARACIESHLRDARILIPWLRLEPKEIQALGGRSAEEAPEWAAIEPFFRTLPTLADAPERFEAALRELAAVRERVAAGGPATPAAARIDALALAIQEAATEASALQRRLLGLAQASTKFFEAMDFRFLYDKTRKLFSIGYRGADGSLDPNCYDLLASEARLTSFIAIAKGDVPSSHWFRLGRALTPVGRGSALISWSGSMFEYLMPALVMRSPAGSLLSQTYEQVVLRQIEYGAERSVPWGISESAFSARDLDFTYQYSSFGVPGLGLKRGLSEDLVIAPYATALAAMINPAAATQNFARLAQAGAGGAYGFYEALDYTSGRVPEGADVAVVRAYMAHHQGMSLVALANVLTDGVMRTRFHATPIVQATELLLQERTPRDVLVARPRAEEVSAAAQVRELIAPMVRRFTTPHDATPRTQLLSNGRYAVMLTAAGSGYSRWRDIAVTRWREDLTRDCWGTYFYLRDEQTGNVWSAGYQPTAVEPDSYEAVFFEDHAEITRRDRSMSTTLEVVVSSEDDAEMRRVSVTNLGARPRDIQVTSYAEVVLAPQAADAAHPAFSNLFVETEFVPEVSAVLATRRKREDETPAWAAHVLVVDSDTDTVGELQFETDRARFLGRTQSPANPVSVTDGRPLSGTAGSVLDPVMSLRRTVRILPGKTAHLVFSTIVAPTRAAVLELADKYRDEITFERTRTLAWTQSQVELHHLGIGADEAHLFQMLANAVLYSDASLRPTPDVLSRNIMERATLWAQGISGDLPIVLARIDDADDIEIIRQLLRAHEYWRMKKLSADVVILNEKGTSYVQDLQGSLEALVRGSQLRLSPDTGGVSGKIVLLRGDLISPQTRAHLQTVARAVLLSQRGTLSEQITRSQLREPLEPPAARPARTARYPDAPVPQQALQFFNGLGGFADGGKEYVTVLSEGLRTPEPWVNVVANPLFGFLVSESGSGFTWSENSHENQLTPWSNDHVTDTPGEAIYVRDESSGDVWTPTALPIRDETATYVARHGQGYSRFQHGSHGILLDLVQFVPPNDPIKISRLTLQNDSGRSRRLSVTAYVEWVLGSARSATAPYLITELDTRTGALLARSAWNDEFGGRIAFADLGGKQTSYTGDRTEFLGRNGSAQRPAALERGGPLSGKVGAALDPCGALQTQIELRDGARVEILFFLGQAENRERVRELLGRYRAADMNKTLAAATAEWENVLGAVQVQTPEQSMDLLLNRWLLYQTLSSRVWGRAGFYQLSGAYGFRDQLQDVMALSVAKRGVQREHLLRAAAHQFVEGDVQHWWHPPSGRGIRTRMSDDLLWLPYVVIQFLEATCDMTVLDELVPFLEGEQLAEGQKESYFQPRVSDVRATLFEHCARALDRSLQTGSHGLPLMGTGDWNDGMNRVGTGGKGESVWLGWFLHTVLWEFAKLADARGERQRAETWRLHVTALKAAMEREAWDGDWYLRAFFDDGTPLGSAKNAECRIDSIAQSWSIISGAAEPGRGTRSMTAVDEQLVRRADALVLLLTPPFDRTDHDPGYIRGYVPGIRENGGQYTHAAVWTLIAFAALSNGDKATEIFRMLNPINHTSSRANVQRYKVEPYVVAGDVYAEPPHTGRGGWTWYTGAAGWLYRAGLEWLLGFRLRGMTLSIDPCIPRNWPGYRIEFRYHSATYKIKVENPSSVTRGVALTELDGKMLAGSANIRLADDGAVHNIRILLG